MTDLALRLTALRRHRFRAVRLSSLWQIAATAILTVLACLPLLFIAVRGSEVGWSGALALIFRPYVGHLLISTVELCAGVSLGSTVVGVLAAWCVERCDLPGRRLWRILLPMPMAIPSFVSAFAWVSLSANAEGMLPAIAILTLAEYPLIYLPVAAALRGMDPALEDVARSLGHSPAQTFFSAVLPQLRPALGNALLLIALYMLAEFGSLGFMRVDTFTTAIFQEYEQGINGATGAMLSAVLLAICLGLMILDQKVRGSLRYARVGGGTPRRIEPHRLGWTKAPLMIILGAVVALGSGAPLAALGYWLAVGTSASFPVDRILGALTGSLTLATEGTLVVTATALLLVLGALRRRTGFSRFADRLPYVLHSLPGLVVALSLVYASLHVVPILYQSTALVMIAYALQYLPLAQTALRAALEQMPESLEWVARSLGRTPWQVLVSVTLPSIAAGLGNGMVMVFLRLMKDLTATLVLAPTGTDTLATEVWTATSNMTYAAAAPYAALIVLLSGLPGYAVTLWLKGARDA